MQTGWCSLRLGIAKYILPFVFVFAPGLVFVGTWDQILLAIMGGFAGIYALTATTEGWIIFKIDWPLRILMALCAFLFFTPGLDMSISGFAIQMPYWLTHVSAWTILGLVYFMHKAKHRNALVKEATL